MKKKLLWLCGLLLAVLLCGCNGEAAETTEPEETLPELYYNLDSAFYGLKENDRPKGEDGLYHFRFAKGDQVVELTCKDEKLVRYIDSLPVLIPVTDEKGSITAVETPDTSYQVLCDKVFVRTATAQVLNADSSISMIGIPYQISLTDSTVYCDITSGSPVLLSALDLKPLDRVTAFGDEAGNALYVFVDEHPTESTLYWRTSRKFDSKKGATSREPDENGVYSVDFYCRGETVTLTCTDAALVTAIDAPDADSPYFGLVLDEEGQICEVLNAAFSLRGVLACVKHEVTELSGNAVKTKNLLSGKGETWDGTVSENCRIYDISKAAYSENRRGQAVDSIRLGDRITVFTDTENRAIEIYILNRLVDVPIYFSTSRKYSSSTSETTREPDAEGWYSVSLVKEGDNKAQVYKTRDKDLMTYLDSTSGRCVGIVADENNVLQRVYHPECLFGASSWSNGSVVSDTAGPIVNRIVYGKPGTVYNGVMMPDCKVYNVSTTGAYGALTTLRKGDYFYAFQQPTGELVHIYVVRRCLGAETLYFNPDIRYDSEAKETTRTPDSEGFYTFTLVNQGEKVTLKTDSKELASALDAQSSGAACLLVEDGIITEVNAPNYACGGSQVSHGDTYVGLNSKNRHVTKNAEGKETDFAMATDCAIYDVRNGRAKTLDSIPEGAAVTVYTNRNGEALVIFVRG